MLCGFLLLHCQAGIEATSLSSIQKVNDAEAIRVSALLLYSLIKIHIYRNIYISLRQKRLQCSTAS